MRRVFAALVLLSCPPLMRAEQVVMSEVMYHPRQNKPEFIELWNITNTPLDFAKWRFSEGITFQFPDFTAGTPQEVFLKAGERIVVSSADQATTRNAYGIPGTVRVYGPWVGSLDNAGENIALLDKNGVQVCAVDYRSGGRWPRAADGTGHSLVLKNENNTIDEPLNWRVSSAIDGSAGVAEPSSSDQIVSTVVDLGDTWKYNVPAADPGPSWRDLAFDDNSWLIGPGLIGYSSAPGTVPSPGLQTSTPTNKMVVLFRKTFVFDGDPQGALFVIDQIVDDGVVYYLNGQPLGSIRVASTGAWDRPANTAVNPLLELTALTNFAPSLVNGTNVLSAEVHNVTVDSSDLVFGARFKIVTPTSVRISEVHFTAGGGIDWVEIENGGSTRSASGLFLASNPDFSDKVALDGNLPGAGFKSFDVAFPGAVGEGAVVYLIDASNRILSVADVEHLPGRASIQAVYPSVPLVTSSWEMHRTLPEWYSSAEATRDAANNPPINTSVVINEIMYDLPSDEMAGEFIEFYNKGAAPVPLAGWKLRGGIDFDFPAGASIPVGGFVIVGGNQAYLQSAYPGATVVGSWSGRLGNRGDLIRLVD